ncbi:MAG: hypothetical protein Q9168_002407 [Polycauliona sp. 1 TL-2023]
MLGRPIFDSDLAYQEALDDYVPREFHKMTILFNVPLLEAWYPKAGKHDHAKSQHAHMTQPLQLFSLLRPDFDLYWQVELDVRYTGHHYRHLEAIRQFAEKQPRKLQWERASYFYSPFIHRTWTNFCNRIHEASENGGVWGAVSTTGITAIGPDPPTLSAQQDEYEWGVGEPADMINILPTIGRAKLGMMSGNLIKNHPERRYSTPLVALSKRLLRAMHHSQITRETQLMPEMLPGSTALQHGMKAVVFPEPIYLDIDYKSPEELEAVFNEQGEDSVWNDASSMSRLAQHVSYWGSTSNPKLSNELYRRWLGVDSDGNEMGDYDPELCLPAVILHPVKEH